MVVACGAVRTGGSGNDVVALIAEEALDALRGPIRRVAPPSMPVPFHRRLEGRFMPGPDQIAAAARSLLHPLGG